MIQFIFVFLIIFKNINSQIHLNRDNLAVQCNCNLSKSIYENILFLDSRRISAIDLATFRDLNSLTNLYLHQNQIREIDPATFNSLKSLQKLDLSHNKISAIDLATFRGLTFLLELRIDDN